MLGELRGCGGCVWRLLGVFRGGGEGVEALILCHCAAAEAFGRASGRVARVCKRHGGVWGRVARRRKEREEQNPAGSAGAEREGRRLGAGSAGEGFRTEGVLCFGC